MLKFPKKDTTRSYELTVVIPGDRTSTQVTTIVTSIQSLAKKHKVKIIEEIEWGKKTLSYQIAHNSKRFNEGYYQLFILESDTSKIKDFEGDLLLNSEIMRYLLVVADNQKAGTAVQSNDGKNEDGQSKDDQSSNDADDKSGADSKKGTAE